MIVHPIVLAASVLDLVALLLFAVASGSAVRIALHYEPDSDSRRQLLLERRAEEMSLLVRGAAWALLFSTLLFLLAVASVLPALVPGAMCGTGVLQATGVDGVRTIAFQLFALLGIGAWSALDTLNRAHPRAPLTVVSARAALALLPLVFLLTASKIAAWGRLRVEEPVSCCAALYEQAASDSAGAETSNAVVLWVAGTLASLLVLLSVLCLARRRPAFLTGAIALSGLLFVPFAAIALARTLVAYHYEVLDHSCLLCLFLGEHDYRGYPLLLALLVVAASGLRLAVADGVGRRYREVEPLAMRDVRRRAWLVLGGTLLFIALATGPALWWRLRFGVWIEG